jgi:L-asparaginase II
MDRRTMTDPVLVEVTRGDRVESHHRGAIAVVDAHGKRRTAIGDIERPIFPRSAIKSMQALALVESGAADRYGFGNAELALACASHNAEPRHVATALKMLSAAGRGEADLACGGHIPMDKAAADGLVRAGKPFGRVHDNCSGKHSGFICLACAMGVDPKGYERPDHPTQVEVRAAIEDVTGAKLGPDVTGVDGCSAPAYAISLEKLAFGFARMVTGEGLGPKRGVAARRLIDACTAEPFMMAGTGRFDTEALGLFGGRFFVKGGAEGVFCGAFPELGLGVAIKCEDGAQRGPEMLMAAVIDALLPLTEAERAAFAHRLRPPIMTRVGVKVGELRPVDGLMTMLREGRETS